MSFLLPILSPLCLANLLLACHPLCYGLSYMSVWTNSFVFCLGAAERIRLAGSRQLVERRLSSFGRPTQILRFYYRASHLFTPFVTSGSFCYLSYMIYIQGSAHCEDHPSLLNRHYFLKGVSERSGRVRQDR